MKVLGDDGRRGKNNGEIDGQSNEVTEHALRKQVSAATKERKGKPSVDIRSNAMAEKFCDE